MGFDIGLIPAVIVSFHKDKGGGTECKNYKGVNFVSMVGSVFRRLLYKL